MGEPLTQSVRLEEKHTPGPWSASTDYHSQAGRTNGGFYVRLGAEDFGGAVAKAYSAYVGEEAAKANCRLIAAAPELLAACRAIADLKGWDKQTPISATGIQVMAAIRKAEGLNEPKASGSP